MNSRHRKTLEALYERPERADIAWREIEALLLAHPQKETDKGAVKSVRRFLQEAGVEL